MGLFQKGSETCILQNGFVSNFFSLRRGCRQGDPISPYLFILCAEILGKMVRKNKEIKGISINKNIGRGKILCKNWHEKGIRVVFNIIGQNGKS